MGQWFYGSDDATLRNAARMVEEPDYYQVLLHGYPQHFGIVGVKTPANEVARSLL
jgi:hypothetical protein